MNTKVKAFYMKKTVKRICAFILAFVMVCGMAVNGTPMTAYAATELVPENLPDRGASDVTLYAANGVSKSFDLQGLLSSSTTYPGGIKTTYGNAGYQVYINSSRSNSGGENIKPTSNGAVQTAQGVEVRLSVAPSKDNKYVFVDYTVYNPTNNNVTRYIATSADMMLGSDDYPKCFKTTKGVHMVSDSMYVFDLISNDPSLGLTTPTDTVYIGRFGNATGGDMFSDRVDDLNIDPGTNKPTVDGGIAFSWTFNLRPYETVTKRVAFAVRSTSYYVSSSGNNGNSGEYDKPFATIDYAISKIPSGGKGYIYIMDNNFPINRTYTIDNNKDITIASTDLNTSGNPTAGTGGYVKNLSRGGSFLTQPLFQVNSGTLRFTDIVVDGGNLSASAPLVATSSGMIEAGSGSVFQNAKNTLTTTAAALDVTGSGKLGINYGTIRNNTSNGKGAVHFSGAANGFELRNNISITGNKDMADKASNVYLGTGKFMTIQRDLEASSIGVTLEQNPEASVEGVVNNSNQEVKVVALGSLPSGSTIDSYLENFTADAPGTGGKGLQLSVGTGGSIGNGSNVVMRRVGYTVSFGFKDQDTGGTVASAPVLPDGYYGNADAVTIQPPAPIIGYELKRVVIEQGSGSGLTANTTAGADFGKITGTMPAQDVVITYEFMRMPGSLSFIANGGTPQPETMVGTAGAPVTATLPSISRYGYDFKGWSTVDDRLNPSYISALPSTYPDVAQTYYAIFTPNNTIKFNYTVTYTNKSGSLMFQTGTVPHVAEDALGSGKKNIKGYVWSKADSTLTPATFDYDGSGAVASGAFASDGTFTGKMPNQDMTVNYAYSVDRSDENNKSKLKVNYISNTGTVLQAATEGSFFPEDEITATPVNKYGYILEKGEVTKGNIANTTGNDLTSAVTGSFDSKTWNYRGTMPNQPVEITYTYKPTGEGYPYVITYIDNNSADENLKKIQEIVEKEKKAEAGISAVQKVFYGYTAQSKTAVPASSGTFASDGAFTGKMPADKQEVNYSYDRDSNLWKALAYQSGINGSLNLLGDTAADVKAGTGGTYKADILIDNGSTMGAENAYTIDTISKKKLTPNTVGNKYYRFGGWFIDTNGNKTLDGGETILASTHRFTGSETLTAYFEKDPEQWYDIKFDAGTRGSINAGEPKTMNLPFDTKWGTFTLPEVTPEINYLFDQWYDGDKAMKAGDPIQKDHTYTARFYPDPDIFGTEVASPDVTSSLDDKGSGKITVYQTNESYQYILTDSEGKVVAIKKGSSVGGSIYFEGLTPGKNYQVYEAERTVTVEAGTDIGTATGGNISEPSRILTPVLDQNYRVDNDKKDESKAILVINPADINTDYAVLDKDGNVVITAESNQEGWQTPKAPAPSQISFSGLDRNGEYTIVARPKNATDITPESKLGDGTAIVADPNGNIQMPKFVVETINGKIIKVGSQEMDTYRYEEAHAKEQVTILADETDVAGNPFKYWKVTVGAVDGVDATIKQREVSFAMPNSSVVMTAYYDKAFTGKATVTDDGRGTSGKEFALNPADIPNLEDQLTTPEDDILINTNNADVTYKVVYKKGMVKASESNAVREKEEGTEYEEHKSAYTAAWGLNVDMERYVNGRKVSVASSSNAEFTTYVHLNEEDVDMLDYRLYRVGTDDDGNTTLDLVTLDVSPDETGGLFTFTTKAGDRYILIYSKSFRLYFQNILEKENFQYYFNVRKGEAPSNSSYEEKYQVFLDYDEAMPQTMTDKDGMGYTFTGWSYSPDVLNRFNEDRVITKETTIYGYYVNNKGELDEARNELDEAILAAIKMSDDYFLRAEESAAVKEAIANALRIFEKTGPKATAQELEEALDTLRKLCKPYEDVLEKRYEHYENIKDSASSGGHGGGGGSGSGTKKDPFGPGVNNNYTVGTNGHWVQDQTAGGQWKFVLNGGIELKSQWAKLSYSGSDAQKNGWYHFDKNGVLSTGWFMDEYGSWYYSRTENDERQGLMVSGWYQDPLSSMRYYLDPITGAMATGWKLIDGKWYYFSSQVIVKSDGTIVKPGDKTGGRPIGSMYTGEKTPDGYTIGSDGQWKE